MGEELYPTYNAEVLAMGKPCVFGKDADAQIEHPGTLGF
jgi:hypothetical protein